MSIDGINNVGEKSTKYTMEQLGIKPGSREASIFNKIDGKDPNSIGYLTEDEYSEYQRLINEQDNIEPEKSWWTKIKELFNNARTFNSQEAAIEANTPGNIVAHLLEK